MFDQVAGMQNDAFALIEPTDNLGMGIVAVPDRYAAQLGAAE